MNHPFTFIRSRAWRYFVHWSLWMFTLDEMRMKTAFTPFTLDESSAMHIQSVKCKFALRHDYLCTADDALSSPAFDNCGCFDTWTVVCWIVTNLRLLYVIIDTYLQNGLFRKDLQRKSTNCKQYGGTRIIIHFLSHSDNLWGWLVAWHTVPIGSVYWRVGVLNVCGN